MQDTIEEKSIDQILHNIKNAINKRVEESATQQEDDPLELTNQAPASTVNEEQKKSTGGFFNRSSERETILLSEQEVRELFKDILRPYLKSWLTVNLPIIAKEAIAIEIKALLKK